MCLKPAIFSRSKNVENNENRIYNIWPTKKSIVRCSNIQWLSLSCPIKQPPGAIELNLQAISQKRIGINPTRHWFLDKSSTVHFTRVCEACHFLYPPHRTNNLITKFMVRPFSCCPSTREADYWKCPFRAYMVYSRVPLWRTCNSYFYFCSMLLWSPNLYQSFDHWIYCIN